MTLDGQVVQSPSERADAAQQRANLLAAELEALKAKLASSK
jgi:hypothetical protein